MLDVQFLLEYWQLYRGCALLIEFPFPLAGPNILAKQVVKIHTGAMQHHPVRCKRISNEHLKQWPFQDRVRLGQGPTTLQRFHNVETARAKKLVADIVRLTPRQSKIYTCNSMLVVVQESAVLNDPRLEPQMA